MLVYTHKMLSTLTAKCFIPLLTCEARWYVPGTCFRVLRWMSGDVEEHSQKKPRFRITYTNDKQEF